MRIATVGPNVQWTSSFVSYVVYIPLQLGGQVVVRDTCGIFSLILMMVFGIGLKKILGPSSCVGCTYQIRVNNRA